VVGVVKDREERRRSHMLHRLENRILSRILVKVDKLNLGLFLVWLEQLFSRAAFVVISIRSKAQDIHRGYSYGPMIYRDAITCMSRRADRKADGTSQRGFNSPSVPAERSL
jgi:hypothetical protein